MVIGALFVIVIVMFACWMLYQVYADRAERRELIRQIRDKEKEVRNENLRSE